MSNPDVPTLLEQYDSDRTSDTVSAILMRLLEMARSESEGDYLTTEVSTILYSFGLVAEAFGFTSGNNPALAEQYAEIRKRVLDCQKEQWERRPAERVYWEELMSLSERAIDWLEADSGKENG